MTLRPTNQPIKNLTKGGVLSLCLHRRKSYSPVDEPTASTSTGEQPTSSGRQFSYPEVSAAYTGIVAGRPLKRRSLGVDSSAPLPTKVGATKEDKGTRDEKASLGPSPVSKSPGGRRAPRWFPPLSHTWTLTPPR